MFKIEDNVPMKNGVRGKYPFGDMRIGQSFSVHGTDKEKMRAVIAAHVFGKYHGLKFASRKQDDGSVRIHRTA